MKAFVWLIPINITVKCGIILACFNDIWVVLFTIFMTYALQKSHMVLATVFFALAVTCKMSALLVLPGYLFLLVCCKGLIRSIPHVVLLMTICLGVSAPFLWVNSEAYLA